MTRRELRTALVFAERKVIGLKRDIRHSEEPQRSELIAAREDVKTLCRAYRERLAEMNRGRP